MERFAEFGSTRECDLCDEETVDADCQCLGTGQIPVTVSRSDLAQIVKALRFSSGVRAREWSGRWVVEHFRAIDVAMGTLAVFEDRDSATSCVQNLSLLRIPEDRGNPNREALSVVFTDEDVVAIADIYEISYDVARDRVKHWRDAVEEHTEQIITERLRSVICGNSL